MGFFGSLGKLVQGKPVFEASTSGPSSQPTESPIPTVVEQAPVAEIVRVNCHLSGTRMDLYVHIRNESRDDIEIKKVNLFGSERNIDHFMKPGEEREFLIYSGEQPATTGVHECEVIYRDCTSQRYFGAVHMVQYKIEAGNTYSICEFRLEHPIRDRGL